MSASTEEECVERNYLTKSKINVYIYIYIYINVCIYNICQKKQNIMKSEYNAYVNLIIKHLYFVKLR